MARYGRKAHRLEQLAQRMRIGAGEFDELEAVCAEWILVDILRMDCSLR